LYKTGEYRLSNFDLSNHFDEDMIHIEKWVPSRPLSTVYFDAEKDMHFVKRFLCEVTSDKKVSFISESEGSYMDVVSTAYQPNIKIVYNKLLKETKNLPDNEVQLADFIDVKGMKAQGNQLTKLKVKEIVLTHPVEGTEPWPEDVVETIDDELEEEESAEDTDDTTVEWDLTKNDEDDQMTLF
jgi:topoisomerase-4 subunit A